MTDKIIEKQKEMIELCINHIKNHDCDFWAKYDVIQHEIISLTILAQPQEKMREELIKFVEDFENNATNDIEGIDSIDANQYLLNWIPCKKDVDDYLKNK